MGDTIEIIQGTATTIEIAGLQGPQGPAGASQGDVLTTQGDLLYRGASAAARLGIGTAGQILKVNAGATAPEWGAAPASGVSSVAGRTGDVTLAVADVSGAVSTSDSRLTDSRTPSSTLAHKASHATGGTDALAPSDISAAWLQTISSITVSSAHQLTAARNQRVLVNDTASAGSSVAIFYPTSGNAEGDRLEVVYASRVNNTQPINVRTGQFDYTGSRSINLGYQRTFIYVSGAWVAGTVEAHTHDAAEVASGIFNNARINFASPAAIGNTAPAAISGTTGTFTTLSAAPTSGSALTLTGGTVTASAPLIDATQTWNNGAVTFTGLRVNITNTASGASSIPVDFQVGGSSQFRVRRSGGGVDIAGTGSGVRISDYEIRGLGGGLAVQSSSGNGLNFDGTTMVTLNCSVFEQRTGTTAQEFRLFGTHTSATNYQRMTIKAVRQTLSALSGASATTTGTFIPDGAVVVGVTTRVSTLLTGGTGYTIGDGTDADRWGDITGTAVGTTSDNRDWTAGTIECFTAGGNITLTAKTSNFTAGAIEICAFYLAGEAD
jgi:hypothetical protein